MATNDLNLLLSTDKPVEIPLENPVTFEPLLDDYKNPATLIAWGPDSEVMRAVEKQISAEMMELASRSRGRPFKPDVAKYNRNRFLARIDGWIGLNLNGVPFEYTADTKAQVYDDPKFGLIRQMFETALADPAAFLVTKT